jgi:hypothetical protein
MLISLQNKGRPKTQWRLTPAPELISQIGTDTALPREAMLRALQSRPFSLPGNAARDQRRSLNIDRAAVRMTWNGVGAVQKCGRIVTHDHRAPLRLCGGDGNFAPRAARIGEFTIWFEACPGTSHMCLNSRANASLERDA